MQSEAQRKQLDAARAKRWGIKTWRERNWEKVVKSDGCWEWKGAHTSAGYGQFQVGTRNHRTTTYSHRWVYEEVKGPIPVGLELDHLCRNPGCCNPDHLEPVTHRENMRRGKQGMKLQCKYGHDWSNPRNVYIRHTGVRWCAECARTRWSRKSKKK